MNGTLPFFSKVHEQAQSNRASIIFSILSFCVFFRDSVLFIYVATITAASDSENESTGFWED
jgi:hypothetical protein